MKALVFKSAHLLGALLLSGGLACGEKDGEGVASTGVGNPYQDPEVGTLALGIVADEQDVAPGDAESLPQSRLTQAVLVLGSVIWRSCDETELDVEQTGPFVVDLLSGTTEPELPVLDASAGGMCGFDAVLAPARDSASLGARSLYFAGTRADGVEFVLFANVRATLRVRAASAVAWGTDDNLRLLWALRPRRWAAPMELDMAEPRVWNGGRRRTIVIDAGRHPLLYASIRSRLASESTVFRDEDLDRQLDAAERLTEAIGTGSTDTDD